MSQRKHVAGVVVVLAVAGLVALVWPRQASEELAPTPVEEQPVGATTASQPQSLPDPPADIQVPGSTESPAPDRAECKARLEPYNQPSGEEFDRIVGDAIVLLRSTQGYENMLAAAMLSRGRDNSAAVDLLNALGGEDATDPFVLWTGLNMCEGGSIGCDYSRVEANVRLNHSSNSAFWIALAGNDLAEGLLDDALVKIDAALSAPGYDGYFADRYLLLDRALAASTNWSAPERAMQIVRLNVSRPPGLRAVIAQCANIDAAAWAERCDQLVTKLQEADEVTARVYAYELQMKLLEVRGQKEQAIALRDSPLRSVIGIDGDEELLIATANLLFNDEMFLNRFLQDVESLGELAAFRQMTKNVAELRKSDRYEECEYIANPYIEF